MPASRSRVGVSADAFVAVVRAYADRVHDDVRRLGCSATEAAEVVETSALGLCERLRARPHEVGDLVGAWFRDARVYAERVASGSPPDDLDAGGGIVHRSEDDAAAREALAQLGERDRVALLLRDAYDLPYVSTGVALGTTTDVTGCVVGRARLRFLALATGSAPEDPTGHDKELAATARLADGQLPPEDVPGAERHAAKCAICGPLLPAQRDARRLLTGLAIIAMNDADRDGLIARATAVAQRLLPTADEVAAAVNRGPEARVLPVTAVLGALGGAVVLGIVVALAGGGPDLGAHGSAPSFDPDSPSPTATPSSATPTPTPTSTRPSTTPSRSASPTPTATASSASPTPTFTARPGDERIALAPSAGPNNTTVNVTGTGWVPGEVVRLRYESPIGGAPGATAEAVADASGRFTTSITAHDPQNIPGPHTVRASSLTQSTSATYTATT
jgi:DNA-directed RNA polymerase specialized sigma24 family protein